MSKAQRDALQVAAFKSIYKARSDLPKEERFLYAICATCDEVFDRAPRALIKEWQITYARKHQKRGGITGAHIWSKQ